MLQIITTADCRQHCVIRNPSDTYFQQEGNALNFDTSSFKTESNLLYRSLLNTSRDLLQYKTQLDDLVTWLNSATASLSNVAIPNSLRPPPIMMNSLNSNASSLSALYDTYLAANISKADFAQNIANLSFYTNIQTNVASIMTELENSIWSPLASFIDEQHNLLVYTYYTLLSKFASMQQFLTKSDSKRCDAFLRLISLWRKPSISRQTQAVSGLHPFIRQR